MGLNRSLQVPPRENSHPKAECNSTLQVLREVRWPNEDVEEFVNDFFLNKLPPLLKKIRSQQPCKKEQKDKAMAYIMAVCENEEVWK